MSSRLAYLDCVGGLAGDMLLAALLDAGAELETLRGVPSALGIEGVEIAVERVERQGIGALHLRVDAPDDHVLRDYGELRGLVESAELPPRAKTRSLDAFARLAEVEGGIHGVSPDDVHFHELGSLDTLVDVCGAFVLLEELGVERVVSSPLPFARGFVKAAHGVLPLPAPATLGLLEGASFVGADIEAELVTPTGAAIAATVVEEWGALPPLTLERVGYGAGTKELDDRPNVVRVVIGNELRSGPTGLNAVVLLETNLDDFLPELVPDAVERCFAAGALDVWTVAAQMKKSRPGFVLSVLARPDAESTIARALLEETSALGVRVSRLDRYELEREERRVEVAGGTVRVKIGLMEGRVVNVAPEHDDCAALASATGRAVQSVWAEALVRAQNP
ncbi:MAG TPA: nickel pincer cofactor biosynthesis protein LarC [Gaiellaceae bacterium]|nr:nickel pincer cofactor biosynthesis protein LarC [Gaiellaceae bacterium]